MEYCNAGDIHGLVKYYKTKGKFIKEEDIWHLIV